MDSTEPSPPQYSALAIASFVLGLLGLVLCPLAPLLGLPGVICGHIGLSRIGKSGGALTGKRRLTHGWAPRLWGWWPLRLPSGLPLLLDARLRLNTWRDTRLRPR